MLEGEPRYRRGFPIAGRVASLPPAAIRAVVGEPAWSTFERLSVRGEAHAELLLHPVLARLRHLKGASMDVARALAVADPPRPLELLEIREPLQVGHPERGEQRDEVRLLAEAPGLPRLLRLTVTAMLPVGPAFSSYGWLIGSPLARRLERLSLRCWWGHQANWLRAAVASEDRPRELALLPADNAGWRCLLRRRESSTELSMRFCRGKSRAKVRAFHRLAEILSRLPPNAIAALHIDSAGEVPLEDHQRERLRQQLRRLAPGEVTMPSWMTAT